MPDVPLSESPSPLATARVNAPVDAQPSGRRPLEAMDFQVTNIQPGGGPVMEIELFWGRVRRWYLKCFQPRYVLRMQSIRQGEAAGFPFDPIDARDVKYYRNQSTYWWADEDDPFGWRDALPFVRVGLAELILIGGGFALLAVVLGWLWWPLSLPPAVVCLLVVWFFRNPHRDIPSGPGDVVSPADGKVAEITRLDDPELGPVVRVGIFLSIFNVHANRASEAGRVIAIRYRPGKFLNALRPESARENEQLEVTLEQLHAPYRLMKIRQITGQFARRIVCWVRPGDVLERGEMFGMIKLGSRTELLLVEHEGLEIISKLGDKVAAGSSLMARYSSTTDAKAAGQANSKGDS